MANRYIHGPTRKDKVALYLRNHPYSTTHDLHAEFGWSVAEIGVILVRMSHANEVSSSKQPGERLLRWCLPEDESDDDLCAPRQIIVKTWTGSPKGSWIDFALCGRETTV